MAKRVPKKEAKKLFINVLLNCSPESDTLRRDFYGFRLTFRWAMFVASSVWFNPTIAILVGAQLVRMPVSNSRFGILPLPVGDESRQRRRPGPGLDSIQTLARKDRLPQ
jgi:hypothetical protein